MKKRALFQKIIALLMAVLLVFACISCGETPQEEESTVDSVVESENSEGSETELDLGYIHNLGSADFNGKTITFFVQDSPCFVHFYDVNVENINSEVVNDKVYERNLYVEATYHVEIEDVKGGGSAPATFDRLLASGDSTYNAVWLKTDEFFARSLTGSFVDLYEVENLDTTKLYWDQNGIRDYAIEGRLYGIMGDISTTANMFTHLFGVNKLVATEYGMTLQEMYQLVFDGDWTFDKFYEYCLKVGHVDVNGNGRDSEDVFGFGTSPSLIFGGWSASGEKWIIKNEEDTYELASLSERKINVLDKWIEFANDEAVTVATWNIGSVPGVTDTYGYTYRTKFLNNTLLFSDLDMGEVLDERGVMEDDFGILPLPKYDKSQEEYSVFAYPFYPLLSIPTTVQGERQSMTGFILEALAAESYKTLTPAFYDIAMGGKVLRDEESTRILDIILRGRSYELLLIYRWADDGFRNELTDMMLKGNNTISSRYKSHSRTLNRAIEQVQEKIDALP